jgi:N-acetyl sugar amidotransferase
MDTTDPAISFNSEGICSHCQLFENVQKKDWYPNKEGEQKLEKQFNEIKALKASKSYDCILGLSGGIDSSYLALKIKEYGLRPLVVHVDGGWNSELAVQNIERIVDYCGWDLHTIVIDWEEMKDLQLAYLKSGIANQDVPQDHAFFASLYHFAIKHNVQYIMSGGNLATECVFPSAWHWSAMDAINLKDIHKRFGTLKLKKYKTISFFKLYFYYPFIKKMKVLRPLNFMPYDKEEALKELEEKIGYKKYARKHGESIFTKFFQNHWLVEYYGYDKRKPHLSSLILSGQLTREDALKEMNNELYNPKELEEDKEYIAKKLGVSKAEFEEIMNMPKHNYSDFKNFQSRYQRLKKLQNFISKTFKLNLSKY